ncbi:MAG TPA: hypothetical protein P5079_10740 [Elusimicrobiota bacterium]|nr:hypothetical protein [Elusimicrobiota bacterium]
MKMTHVFSAAFLCAALVLPGRCAEEGNEALKRWRQAERQKSDLCVDKLVRTLKLTDEQSTALQNAYDERLNKLAELREKFMKDTQAVEAEADRKAVASLPPEQRDKYAAAKEKIEREEREKEMQLRRPPNGEDGPFGRGGPGGGRRGGPGGFGTPPGSGY